MAFVRNNDLGPLFDTPLDRVLRKLPARTGDLFRNLHDGELHAVDHQRDRVVNHIRRVEEKCETVEFLDLETAKRVSTTCLALLDGVGPETPKDNRRLIQAAVLYFVEIDDDDSDTHSPIGFDDDATVVSVVAREVGREDLLK